MRFRGSDLLSVAEWVNDGPLGHHPVAPAIGRHRYAGRIVARRELRGRPVALGVAVVVDGAPISKVRCDQFRWPPDE